MGFTDDNVFYCHSRKINENLEKYLKKIDSEISCVTKSQPIDEDLPEAPPQESRPRLNLNLNFEYKFFKLLKCVFYDDTLITSETDLEIIMNYCLDKCIQQCNLFQMQAITDDFEEADELDELNMIELENNFQINLLNLMHRFKESFEQISNNKNIETHPKNDSSRSKLCYYDYMSALVSIYLDISLNLKSKLKRYNIYEFRKKNFKQTLCVNTYFLLDSLAYYISNALLQMNSINADNLKYIIPIINKIATQPDSCEKNRINTKHMPKSLYLRLLLLYRRLTLSSKLAESTILLKFKEFITSIKLSKKFSKYLLKILKNYFDEIEARVLSTEINSFGSTEELKKFLITELTHSNIESFIHALHKKSIKDTNRSIIDKIENISTEMGKNLCDSNESEDAKFNQEITNENYNQINQDQEQNINQGQENELNNSYGPEILNMYDELEFTSCSELTQYDINAYEYDIVDYDRVHQNEPILTLPLDPVSDQTIVIETKKSQPIIKPNILDDEKLTSDVEIVIEPLDLNKYKQTSKYSYDLSDRECNVSYDFNNGSQGYFSQENTPSRTHMERVYSSRKKYEEISSRITSPTKETISKLNLFRKIYDSDDNEYSVLPSQKLQIEAITPEPKFYKLNDLVSVMVNNECYQMKNNNHFSTNEASNSNKRRIDASKFYQTKLNFKIQKLNSNLNTIASVPNLKADVPLKTPVKPLKKQPKKFVETKKKIQKPTKKTYKKIDYKSVSKKDYELRKRNSIVNYLEVRDL